MDHEKFTHYQLSIHPDFVSYQLEEDEIKVFLSADYGVDSKSGNKTIGKEIVKTINSFHIKKDRECFYAQRVKDLAIKQLSQNKRVGNAIKMGIASNHVHQIMLYEIKKFVFYKKHPDLLEIK